MPVQTEIQFRDRMSGPEAWKSCRKYTPYSGCIQTASKFVFSVCLLTSHKWQPDRQGLSPSSKLFTIHTVHTSAISNYRLHFHSLAAFCHYHRRRLDLIANDVPVLSLSPSRPMSSSLPSPQAKAVFNLVVR